MDYGISAITARIYLGGQFQSLSDVDLLRAHRVTDVLNCREVDDPPYVKSNFAYSWPEPRKPDDGEARESTWFAEGIRYAFEVLCAPDRALYVHCEAGLNRSASMVYAILRSLGLSDWAAREMICQHRLMDIAGIRYVTEAASVVTQLGYFPPAATS